MADPHASGLAPAPVVRRRSGAIAVAATLFAAAFALVGCGTLTTSAAVTAEADAVWALLPIENLSVTPLAGRAAVGLVETRLRARGVSRLARIEPIGDGTLVDLLGEGADRDDGLRRARGQGARYALGGTVHEWHYRSAPAREPVVGLSLRLVDVASGRVLWQGNASRGGWGAASLTALADRVIGELLERIRVRADDAAA